MSAALQIRDGRAAFSRHDRPGRVTSSPLSPATISTQRPSDSGQYAEGTMPNSTRANTVNSRNNAVNMRFRPYVVAATEGVTKEVARETDIAPRTIEDIRCREKLGSVPTFLLLAQRDPRLAAEIRKFLDEGAISRGMNDIMRRMG